MAKDFIPAQGYAFDGLLFQRATINAKRELVNKETGSPLGVEPSLVVWYTRREFTNAIAKLQHLGTLPTGLSLVQVAPTPELMAELKENGTARLTRDHILHMLTAGKEKVLERKFTPAELEAYTKQADAMLSQIEDAYQPASSAAA